MEKKVYLVILEGDKHTFTKYADKYRIFDDGQAALAWAAENGFEDPLHMGVSDQPGKMTFYYGGDYKVSILPQLISPASVTA